MSQSCYDPAFEIVGMMQTAKKCTPYEFVRSANNSDYDDTDAYASPELLWLILLVRGVSNCDVGHIYSQTRTHMTLPD